ncbi:unnamed protein product [Linum trigynum]|uniref:Uncharacterized protein n=1 Tax=Linum trigynum TaxID=586398 RepID=A0AAV2FBG2_9ROSI
MTRSQSGGLLPLDRELERTCRQSKKALQVRLATEEEQVDGRISSDSEQEDKMGDKHNKMNNLNLGQPHLGMPLQVHPLNQAPPNNGN